MSDPMQTYREGETTEKFLKTNGPPSDVFKPDPWVEALVEDLPQDQKILHRSVAVIMKQLGWIIPELSGLKSAHRTIHEKMEVSEKHFDHVDSELQRLAPCLACAELTKNRLEKIDATLDVFIKLREHWMGMKRLRLKIAVCLASLFLLPFLAGLGVEFCKHVLHWGN
jgi:hypothetical protein